MTTISAVSTNKIPTQFWRRSNARISIALCLIGVLALLPFLAPLVHPVIPPITPAHVNLTATNIPPFTDNHLLGTDSLGRDVLGMALWGSRTSLALGLLAALLAVTFGSLWGAVSSLVGGLIDTVMMRIVDGLLAIPPLILLLALSALVNGPAFPETLPRALLTLFDVTSYSLGFLPFVTVISVIAATSWLEAARVAHAKISAIRLEEYVEAARALGAGTLVILFRHLVPNASRIIMIQATLLISDAIVMEAGLSYLGIGLSPDTPSWGTMLRQASSDLFLGNWWAPLVPAALISWTVLSVELLGEGLLEAIGHDDRLR
ncbi:MAG: ABC transporter permease [Candidatus Obscuribacterales bacterium]|nr:ABC transporter permease [Candidatus Obscuribacterales bacterium]